MAKAGSHHSLTFKVFRGLTQIDLLSPTIFNVDVNTVLRNTVMMVAYE